MIVPFDRKKEWGFVSVPPYNRHETQKIGKQRLKNTKLYADWVFGLLKRTYGKELKKGERYTTTGITMSTDNNDFLRTHICPYTFADISPRDSDTLENDVVLISKWVITMPTMEDIGWIRRGM